MKKCNVPPTFCILGEKIKILMKRKTNLTGRCYNGSGGGVGGKRGDLPTSGAKPNSQYDLYRHKQD